jgi:hypothetical protein
MNEVNEVTIKKNDENQTIYIDNQDWLLEALVISSSDDQPIAITILCSGFLISGNIISAKEYFKELVRINAFSNEAAEALVKQFENIPSTIQPTYIHLKKAKFFDASGKSIPHKSDNSIWRGKINDVSGFFFGELETQ